MFVRTELALYIQCRPKQKSCGRRTCCGLDQSVNSLSLLILGLKYGESGLIHWLEDPAYLSMNWILLLNFLKLYKAQYSNTLIFKIITLFSRAFSVPCAFCWERPNWLRVLCRSEGSGTEQSTCGIWWGCFYSYNWLSVYPGGLWLPNGRDN